MIELKICHWNVQEKFSFWLCNLTAIIAPRHTSDRSCSSSSDISAHSEDAISSMMWDIILVVVGMQRIWECLVYAMYPFPRILYAFFGIRCGPRRRLCRTVNKSVPASIEIKRFISTAYQCQLVHSHVRVFRVRFYSCQRRCNLKVGADDKEVHFVILLLPLPT